MNVVLASYTQQLDPTRRLRFYAELAHHLTVICRSISHDKSACDERLWALYQLNEIQHIVTDHIITLHRKEIYHSEESMEDMMRSFVTKAPLLEAPVTQVILWAYEAALA